MTKQPFGIEMEERELMAHRYLYYCLGTPIIPDREYDRREKMFLGAVEAEGVNPEASPIGHAGSDLASSYSEEQIRFAMALKEARGT